MRAIILAAGMGIRLGQYTKNIPKAMLSFNGKPLIKWQIEKLREIDITDINVVTGYMHEKIDFDGLTYFYNPDYASTNMVESLMCARDILNTELIVLYSDIIFTNSLVDLVANCKSDIGVAVDKSWRDYWKLRYGSTENDLETLSVENGKIVELGKTVDSSCGIDYRYIGIIKFSDKGIQKALEIYDNKKASNEAWMQSGKPFKQGYMTDLLNELIIKGHTVEPIISDGGWVEFDTVQDYEVMIRINKEGRIDHQFF